jgi:hypothetical protein
LDWRERISLRRANGCKICDVILRDGLTDYRRANNLPDDGGVRERWAVVRIGPVPVAYPNIAARRVAVPYHDLHHVVTGYATDLRGEAEISAWEIGSGAGRFWFVWLINLSAIVAGLRWPLDVIRAFARGRQCKNLFGAPYEQTVMRPVSEIRGELGLDRRSRVGAADLALFALLLPLGAVTSVVVLTAALVTSPWWLTAGVHRRRRQPANRNQP